MHLLAHNSISIIGNWHYLFLHFPIALLITAGIAELLNYLRPNILFDQAARFMLLAAAFFIIPTVLFGLILSESGDYDSNLLMWHKIFGALTLFLTWFAAYLREQGKRNWIYGIALILAIISVSIAGYFGGLMSFGEVGLPF